MAQQSEMTVITKAKNLCSYVMTVTQKSPKQFRFSLIGRMQGYVLDIVERLYEANEIFVSDERTQAQRLKCQREAMTRLKLLDYVAELSAGQGAIQFHQYEQIALQAAECQKLLGAWMASARRKTQSGSSPVQGVIRGQD